MGENKIPKVIHCFWFGNGQMSSLQKKCIESWKKHCSDFEIKIWNEDTYDITKSTYMKQAAEAGKWSFVTDYARLDIIYSYGGIYLDTDVEVLRNLSYLCNNEAFIGFENEDRVNDGSGFGAIAAHPMIGEMLSVYDNLKFINEDGSYNIVESPKYRTSVLLKHGLKQNGRRQVVGGMTIYPVDYLNPKNYINGKITITENTYSIHHFEGSWHDKNEKRSLRFMQLLCRLLGEKTGRHLFVKIFQTKDKIKKEIKR